MFSEENLGLLLAALRFSAEKHRCQRRKDQEASPYINHPIEVAETLWRIGGVRDTGLLIAALLHDTLEDTETTEAEITGLFGAEVAGLVREVSDDKSLPHTERKRLQILHAAHISLRARQLKLADKICNARDIARSPPRDWPLARKQEYLEWTAQVVAGLRGCNPALEACYDEVFSAGIEMLALARQAGNPASP